MKKLSIGLMTLSLFIFAGCAKVDSFFNSTPQSVPDVKQVAELPFATVQENESPDLRSSLRLDASGHFSALVENKSGKYIEFALYRINFYDKDGVLVAKIVQFNDLVPGGKWKFQAQVTVGTTFVVKTVVVQ